MADSRTEKLGLEPRYSLDDASHLVGVPKSTLRAWLVGTKAMAKVLDPDADPAVGVSFFNLIEARFLAFYRRRHGISMARVRRALDYVGATLSIARPLLTDRFETDGKNLFLEKDSELLDVSDSPGQREWPEVIREYFHSIDFDAYGPTQFWILGRHRPCVIDPRTEAGVPIIPRNAIPIELVHRRFQGFESIPEIANDLGLSTHEVEEALRCNEEIRAAAA